MMLLCEVCLAVAIVCILLRFCVRIRWPVSMVDLFLELVPITSVG